MTMKFVMDREEKYKKKYLYNEFLSVFRRHS